MTMDKEPYRSKWGVRPATRMRHSYGIELGLHFRQPDYVRGQTFRQWLVSANWGAYKLPGWPNLHLPGGDEKRIAWASVTLIGVTLQINIEHALSNWAPTRRKVEE